MKLRLRVLALYTIFAIDVTRYAIISFRGFNAVDTLSLLSGVLVVAILFTDSLERRRKTDGQDKSDF